jgi:hypothetical protein
MGLSRIEKRLAEMAQGVLVSQRAARLLQLQAWEDAHKISMRYDIDGNRRQAWLWMSFQEAKYSPGTLLAECDNNNDFPTEVFVAQVALGIQALSSFDGVKEPEQRPKSESAKHVIDWKKWCLPHDIISF